MFLLHGRYQLGHLEDHPFSLKARPKTKWSVVYVKYKSNVTLFEPQRPGALLGTPKITPKMTQSCICFVAFINLSWYLEIPIYQLSGAWDFINGGGLLIRGGDYLKVGTTHWTSIHVSSMRALVWVILRRVSMANPPYKVWRPRFCHGAFTRYNQFAYSESAN